MSRLHRLVPMLGGLLLSKGGRRLAGRHAGKLALATLAFELWQKHQAGRPDATPRAKAKPNAGHHARNRWSGRPRR